MSRGITALIILDGFGVSQAHEGNAIWEAHPNFYNKLLEEYPHTTIHASGLDVGLPEGQMGNSEVGHLNMGAGRVVYQELTRISKEIKDGLFFEKEELILAIENAKKNNTKLHLMGLVSDGGVHSHMDHIYALIELAKKRGLQEVYVHCFMDGRDVPPASAKQYIVALENKMRIIGIGKIATVMGRYYAMDRDQRWERVVKAYDAIVLGEGDYADSALAAVDQSYNQNITDEFIKPTIIMKGGTPTAIVSENDSIIFFNFRPDRSREITRTFIEPNFSNFIRKSGYIPVFYVSMTQYDLTFTNVMFAYKPQSLKNTFGEYISRKGLKQLRIAETEKYAHVTFFFNGGVEFPNEGEERVLIPSPKVATYDLQPEMSAYLVADEAVRRVESGTYDVMVLNFANPDMVGHTGIEAAAVDAIQTVDACVEKVVNAILKNGGRAIITADHGNAEQMIDYSTKKPFTAHTTNNVPFVLVDPERKMVALRQDGRLADIAPTLLAILGLEKPVEMTGQSMMIKRDKVM